MSLTKLVANSAMVTRDYFTLNIVVDVVNVVFYHRRPPINNFTYIGIAYVYGSRWPIIKTLSRIDRLMDKSSKDISFFHIFLMVVFLY